MQTPSHVVAEQSLSFYTWSPMREHHATDQVPQLATVTQVENAPQGMHGWMHMDVQWSAHILPLCTHLGRS
jgi:hypothetical protein